MPPPTEQVATFLASIGLTPEQVDGVKNRQSQHAEYTLAALFPDAVDFPGTSAYSQSISVNWSALARRNASAVFHPSSAEQVAKALQLVEFFGQEFAVRGGGHSPNPGWASIEGGLLISTDRLNTLHYDEAADVMSIGAGNRWGMVYKYLEKFGVLVTGGHSAPVAAWDRSQAYGWSCDNVLNFEIVVSGGKILNASKTENSELWWALKGGSNNFGIVTRLDMSTIPIPNGVWGGQLVHEWSPELQRKTIEAHYKFSLECIAADPGCESITEWGKVGPQKYIQNVLSADRNVPGGGHPEAFDDFFALNPQIQAGNCKASELAAHDEVPEGGHASIYFSEDTRQARNSEVLVSPLTPYRSSMLCLITKTDLDFLQEAVNIFYEEYKVTDEMKDCNVCLNISPIAAKTIRISNERGGTAPGWAEEDQSLLFMDNVWLHAEDDEGMLQSGKRCIARLREVAKARGVLMPQIWMNNSDSDDDVIGSYGKENWTKLRNISIKYDPKRTFQNLCVGGYKIERE
ncbi:hypothetical protein FSARC_14636 [Fusarium sarcochroum]|uniref:FAD-binding PCMH-type domain-containing protein n=1 Tax=Fusarium sarcochroum TaxID=1208366 RepID=A0A8H4WNU5_9HYPO|nr:hypothetical protein FSARC_14636 [Fusarium sarcochroum]